MPTVTKDVLYPGKYRLQDGTWVEYTAADCRHLGQRLKDMLADGLPVPACWAHQDLAKPMPLEKLAALKADNVKLTLGYAKEGGVTAESVVEAKLEVPDPADAAKLPAVRFVSPEVVRDFVDERGKLWPGLSISHIAVTSRPVQRDQRPFRLGEDTAVPAAGLALARLSVLAMDVGGEKDEGPPRVEGKPPRGAGQPGPEAEGAARGETKAEARSNYYAKVKQLLPNFGIHVPQDTTEKDAWEHLYVALCA